MPLPPKTPWYLPSLYGDIRLTAQANETEVEWEKLSPSEREALTALGKKFSVTVDAASGHLVVPKPIDKVEAVLSSAMKRGRKLLSAVVFANGRVEEIRRLAEGESESKEMKKELVRPDPVKAAVTVAAPTVGCPVPEFERAEIRATRVLTVFLTPSQRNDFERTQSFLVTGGDSGHRYVLTSRHASKERLAKVQGRSVFDVDRKTAICVHDWVVPAAEELLELALFLQLPGHETAVNLLPEARLPPHLAFD
jgi:hypothetical protein